MCKIFGITLSSCNKFPFMVLTVVNTGFCILVAIPSSLGVGGVMLTEAVLKTVSVVVTTSVVCEPTEVIFAIPMP